MVHIYSTPSKEVFLNEFNENGFVLVESGFDDAFLAKYRAAMLELIEVERKLTNQPLDYRDYGFLLCAPYYLDKFPFLLEVLENKEYLKYVEWILDKWFTLHLYSCNCLKPKNIKNKASVLHVDTPRFTPDNYHTFVATMINMDDYTAENGATLILPASHRSMDVPGEEYFYKNAIQLIIPKGTICFFNPRVWHATGYNMSGDWRTCLLIAFCKPWVKQRVDIPKFMNHIDKNTLSHSMQQLLGFHAQPPTRFEEFFGSEEIRTFTQPHV